jgi:hypothetical protein
VYNKKGGGGDAYSPFGHHFTQPKEEVKNKEAVEIKLKKGT